MKLFNRILDKVGLKLGHDGNKRTTYSLRRTYICLRLKDSADIYQIAKNCLTSVETITKHYVSGIKNTIDAFAMRSPPLGPQHCS